MILLDTCVLIWLADHQEYLTEKSKQVLEKHAGNLYVSAISAFEISLKYNKGLLKLSLPALSWFQRVIEWHNLIELPITSSIAAHSTLLPAIHNDPSDRMIIATAIEKSLSILTPDKDIHQYCQLLDLKVIW